MASGEVRVQVVAIGINKGLVVHEHDGASRFHDPSRKHGWVLNLLHSQLDQASLQRPEGWENLTGEQKDQYSQALNGTTFWKYV